jgi:zinc/manganese transport system substrate-binding protein/manganese/iron transport system substrate-binding protein
VLAGCGGSSGGGPRSANTAGGKTLNVVATTTQVQDFTRVIGGDRITLTGILKPNVDPHDFEPSPADLDAIARGDVLVKYGVGLEHWLDLRVETTAELALQRRPQVSEGRALGMFRQAARTG